MGKTAGYWIKKLGLQKHVEGGYYHRSYESALTIPRTQLPAGFMGPRPVSTAIYFLLKKGQKSLLHRIASDELWHFYYGGPLYIHVFPLTGKPYREILGLPGTFQVMVPAGSWFGAIPAQHTSYCLAGCTVSPGFDFKDFELGKRKILMRQFPQESALIKRLTKASE
jgi:uncharacterized protein